LSIPADPVFDISGGNTGTDDIPLVFTAPGSGLEVLWTYDGSDPTSGTSWTMGQVVPYNSWPYINATSADATVYVQAIVRDTTTDEYSSIIVQDYIFTCADPIISQTSTVNVSCSSPDSTLYYYSGNTTTFESDSLTATSASNPCSLSLPDGTYVFFSVTSDGIVYNQNIVDTTVASGVVLTKPTLIVHGISGDLFISAKTSIEGATFHYTSDGSTPTSASSVMPALLEVSSGSSISVLATYSSSISTIATTTIKLPGEYVCLGLGLSDRSLKLSSSIFNTKLEVKSFSVRC